MANVLINDTYLKAIGEAIISTIPVSITFTNATQ